MKIIDCVQGTPEWLEARMGVATASEADALVTPLWKVRTGEGVSSYVCRKLAERWLGQPLQSFSSGAMDQGSIREGEAIPWYENMHDVTLSRPGFVLRDDGSCGCSPDAMGLEVKCPQADTHVGYLLDGQCPAQYRAQVQFSMYVCGMDEWKFLSYCRGFPPLLLPVPSEGKAQNAIAEALADFNQRMAAGWERLLQLNGGPPKRAPKVLDRGNWDANLITV